MKLVRLDTAKHRSVEVGLAVEAYKCCRKDWLWPRCSGGPRAHYQRCMLQVQGLLLKQEMQWR